MSEVMNVGVMNVGQSRPKGTKDEVKRLEGTPARSWGLLDF